MRTWRDEAREHARIILSRMLHAVNPQTLLRERVRRDGDDLLFPDGDRVPLRASGGVVRVAAVGKAAGGLAAHAQRWGPFSESILVSHVPVDVPGFETFVGGHPEPEGGSVAAGERLLQLAAATGPDDTLLLLLSGGGSALCEAPAVPLDDLRRLTRLLLACGAEIAETNAVRKHLSRLKGGRLLQATRGRIVVLAISDVARDDPSALASGPAAPDPTTYAEALDVLRRHDLLPVAPASVRERLEAGAAGRLPETLKPDDPALARLFVRVLAGNADALRAGAEAARALGYRFEVAHEALHGQARLRGRALAQRARRLRAEGAPPTCVLWGGETVVRVEGGGRGGRNQEVALAAVDGLSGQEALLATLGTDGRDGPTDAAGAIVDGLTRARAEALGLDAEAHLQENDAYAFFDALDDLVRTGPTGTNVRDVAVLLVRGA